MYLEEDLFLQPVWRKRGGGKREVANKVGKESWGGCGSMRCGRTMVPSCSGNMRLRVIGSL